MTGRASLSRTAVPKPLYAQVRDVILGRIRAGEWGAGETLPNEFVLATECRVSIGTVRRAVEGLEDAGVVVRKQGRGTFVAGRGTTALQDKFDAFRSPSGERLVTRYTLLALARRAAAAAELSRLAQPAGSDVVEVRQLLEAGRRPLGLEISLLPAALFPRIETQLAFGQHLYPLCHDYGHLVTRVDDRLSVVPADPETAAALDVAPGPGLLRIERIAYALDGRPVETRVGLYRSDMVSYAAALS